MLRFYTCMQRFQALRINFNSLGPIGYDWQLYHFAVVFIYVSYLKIRERRFNVKCQNVIWEREEGAWGWSNISYSRFSVLSMKTFTLQITPAGSGAMEVSGVEEKIIQRI